MKTLNLHSWDLAPKEAIELQRQLKEKIVLEDCFDKIETIAGADISISKSDNTGYAGIIVYTFPDLTKIECAYAIDNIKMPYVPGLLSFREAPLLLKAFARLKTTPDVAMFDGQGIAHPRRIGIASHMGLWLDLPTIGCAKSRLTGKYIEPDIKAGSFSSLKDGTEIIGSVLRTRTDVKPVFISAGHKISLKTAVDITLKCTDGLRIPKPTREADKYVAELKRRD